MSLPATIQELIRLIGHADAMALVREFGGQEPSLPRTESSDLWAAFAEIIGDEKTRLLAGWRGGERVYISLCTEALRADRNRKIIARYERLIKEGHSGNGAVFVIVREFRPIAARTVERIVNSPEPEESGLAVQGALF